jgi:hypothetical protein
MAFLWFYRTVSIIDNFRWTFFILNFDVFKYKLYHIWFFQLSYNPYSGTEFIPNTFRLWEKWRFFYFTLLYPYWVFVKRDKLLSQLIKFKYENIKLKKKIVKRNMPPKLYDKITKNATKISWDYPFNTNI